MKSTRRHLRHWRRYWTIFIGQKFLKVFNLVLAISFSLW